MNYTLKKDLPGLRAGALVQYSEASGEYYVYKDSYRDFYYFTQTEIEDKDWFTPFVAPRDTLPLLNRKPPR